MISDTVESPKNDGRDTILNDRVNETIGMKRLSKSYKKNPNKEIIKGNKIHNESGGKESIKTIMANKTNLSFKSTV